MTEAEEYDNTQGIFGKDWTKGNIFKNLLSLGWPMAVGSMFMILAPTVDMIWVGKLGAASIAGVGVAQMTIMVVNSVRMGLTTGTRALIARYVGAEDARGANHVAQQSIIVIAVYSLATALIGFLLAEQIMRVMGVEEEVVGEGAAYLRIMFIGTVAMGFRMMSEGIMQASGDSVTPMRITMIFRVVHLVICPFLVFGWWIFPRFGASGTALTNAVAQSLGVILSLRVLFSGSTRLRLSLRGFSIDWGIIWRIIKVGVPASGTGLARSLANLLLMRFVSPFGTTAVAAQSLLQRIEMLFRMPSMAFGNASGVLAGQNLGAGRPDRAVRTGWLAIALVSGIMLAGSIVVLIWAEGIIGLFNADPDLMDLGGDFLRIHVVSFIVFGFALVMLQFLNNVGDTMIPMLTTLLTMWLIQVPLAYFLPNYTPLEVHGVRWAISTAFVSRAIVYGIYFHRGRWQRKRV
jgi:putative MATE family efflux protein